MKETGRVGENKASSSKERGMVLPFVPLSLTFDEIRYSVDMPQVGPHIFSSSFN